MSDLHRTVMGQRFFEHTLPELVRQLDRLNRNLERLAKAEEKKVQPKEEQER